MVGRSIDVHFTTDRDQVIVRLSREYAGYALPKQGIIMLWKRNTRGGGDLELGRGVVWIEPGVQRNVIGWELCLNHALQRDSQCGSNIKAMLGPWRAM